MLSTLGELPRVVVEPVVHERHRPAQVAEDPANVRVPLERARVDQSADGVGGLGQEVQRKRERELAQAVRRAGGGRVHEHHGPAPGKFLPERCQVGVVEGAPIHRAAEHDAHHSRAIQHAVRFGERRVDVGQREAGEEAQAPAAPLDQIAELVVEVARQRDAQIRRKPEHVRRRHGHHLDVHVDLVHHRQAMIHRRQRLRHGGRHRPVLQHDQAAVVADVVIEAAVGTPAGVEVAIGVVVRVHIDQSGIQETSFLHRPVTVPAYGPVGGERGALPPAPGRPPSRHRQP